MGICCRAREVGLDPEEALEYADKNTILKILKAKKRYYCFLGYRGD